MYHPAGDGAGVPQSAAHPRARSCGGLRPRARPRHRDHVRLRRWRKPPVHQARTAGSRSEEARGAAGEPRPLARHLHREDQRHPRLDRGQDRRTGRPPDAAEPGPRPADPPRGSEDQAEMRRAAVLAALVLALMPAAAAARAQTTSKPPKLKADAAILVDERTGEVLFAKHPDDRRQIASTTKLMTADLALEHARPTEVFRSPGYHGAAAESIIGLRKGERMTVHDLLRALLLESANDAALTIAVNVADSENAFVDEMNAQASALGLAGTHYENPIGLDDPDNYSTARDLADLASRLMRDSRFAGIVSLPSAALTSGSHERIVHNRNLLVGRYRFVDGVKTGHTSQAGYCLVGAATAKGAHVVSVVLHDPSEAARDSDTLALLQYGLAQYKRVRPVARGAVLARPKIKYRGERASLTVPRSAAVTIRRGERVSKRVDAPSKLDGPIAAGKRVGSVAIVYRGKVVRTLPLVTAKAVPAAGFPRKLVATLGAPFAALAFLALVALCLGALRVRASRAAREETLEQR